MSEHKQRLVEGHTKKYGIDKLVYYETFSDIKHAIHREKQIKRYPREYKYNLIERENLYWSDLSAVWFKHTHLGSDETADPGTFPCGTPCRWAGVT